MTKPVVDHVRDATEQMRNDEKVALQPSPEPPSELALEVSNAVNDYLNAHPFEIPMRRKLAGIVQAKLETFAAQTLTLRAELQQARKEIDTLKLALSLGGELAGDELAELRSRLQEAEKKLPKEKS